MSKYHAQPLVLDNIRFASTKEAHRYQELKLLERAGQIDWFRCQPRFKLLVGDIHLGDYLADFEILTRGQLTYEDVKGFKTPLYKWKKRHTEAQYGVTIVEV